MSDFPEENKMPLNRIHSHCLLLVTSMLLLICPVARGEGYWVVEGHTAKISIRFPQAKDPKALATFYVDWDPSSNCAATIGMIPLLNGVSLSLGKYQGSQKSSENMTLTVRGRSWSNQTMIAKYSNALDVMSYAPKDLLETMVYSDSIQFRFLNSPAFDVPLVGAGSAFDSARKNCR